MSTQKYPILAVLQRKLGRYYSLGRNWAKIEPFWARIRIPNVPKVIQKYSYRPLHPEKPHNSRITKQNRPKNGDFSLGRNWAIFGHVLVHISGSNLPISKIPKDLSPSYCHRAVEKKKNENWMIFILGLGPAHPAQNVRDRIWARCFFSQLKMLKNGRVFLCGQFGHRWAAHPKRPPPGGWVVFLDRSYSKMITYQKLENST